MHSIFIPPTTFAVNYDEGVCGFAWPTGALTVGLSSSIEFTETVVLVRSKCNEDDQAGAALLRLKQSLTFDSSASSKLVTWNSSTAAVLGSEKLAAKVATQLILTSVANLSCLEFETPADLQHLESLKYAANGIFRSQIPSAIRKLTNLKYLNLSHNAFFGQIPIEVSHLTRLTVLDISENYYRDQLKLENPNLSMLVHNLTELEELYLDHVDISVPQGTNAAK
ncbi:unnamed protein product [Prunus armeniaca]|uniref:Leucine-rich repeat-containing N-terminal plant-type domain-containing protein n=1 Tax=Prunus armeniaca TaxID=36596 RepID=A0A6J5WB48_PRUAR|nr:unnamed protein product [Prunus armeniaca]